MDEIYKLTDSLNDRIVKAAEEFCAAAAHIGIPEDRTTHLLCLVLSKQLCLVLSKQTTNCAVLRGTERAIFLAMMARLYDESERQTSSEQRRMPMGN